MTMRVFIPCDAGAIAVGADDVALALEQAAAARGMTLEIVRTGSRGLYWLEPMVEVATSSGRIAFGPVSVADVPSVLEAMVSEGGPHVCALRRHRSAFARGLSGP
jgi:formate dehydrogenase iron-sulfur subunit